MAAVVIAIGNTGAFRQNVEQHTVVKHPDGNKIAGADSIGHLGIELADIIAGGDPVGVEDHVVTGAVGFIGDGDRCSGSIVLVVGHIVPAAQNIAVFAGGGPGGGQGIGLTYGSAPPFVGRAGQGHQTAVGAVQPDVAGIAGGKEYQSRIGGNKTVAQNDRIVHGIKGLRNPVGKNLAGKGFGGKRIFQFAGGHKGKVTAGRRGGRFTGQCYIANLGDGLIQVALNGEQYVFLQLGNDGNGIGTAVFVLIQEDQIAGDGTCFRNGFVQFGFFPLGTHGFRAGVQGNIQDTGVVQTEGDEHGGPVAVGVAVPLAVTGDAPADAGIIHLEIEAAFCVVKLRLGYHNDIFCGDGTAYHTGQGHFPVICGFQVCVDITVAVFCVDMFRQGTGFRNAVAFLTMTVALSFFQSAEETVGVQGVAFLRMEMGLYFRDTAGISGVGGITGFVMGVIFRLGAGQYGFHTGIRVGMFLRFFQTAGGVENAAVGTVFMGSLCQGAGQRIQGTFRCVGMAFLFREEAGEASVQTVGAMGMGLHFCEGTGQFPGGAFFCVNMLVITAEGFARHGDAGKLQTPEDAANDQQGKQWQNTAEAALGYPGFLYLGEICVCIFSQMPSSFLYRLTGVRERLSAHPGKFRQGPDFAENLADDLVLGDAADHGAAAVDRGFPVVTHHEVVVFRHLIGKFHITFAQRFFGNVRLDQFFTVEVNGAVRIDPQVITGGANDPFDQYFIGIIEGAQVAGFQIVGLYQQNDVAVFQAGFHAGACDLQDRQHQRGDERRNGGHHDEGVDGAAQQAAEAASVAFTL